MNRVRRKIWYMITQTIYKGRFGSIGKMTVINSPIQLDCVNSIIIKDRVYIAEGSWFMGSADEKSTLVIETGTTIGHFCHIVAKKSVKIEENVLVADKVFISDCTHSFEDVKNPIINQKIKMLSSVTIGEGSWLGENVCICGASIGKHCVIGANSVVIKDIPDFCVAVGSPARVIKKYDFEKKEWVPIKGDS